MPIKCSRSTCPDAAPKLQCQSGRPALGSSRPSCEPQQARGIPRNLRLNETVAVRYGVIWRISELVGESSAKFGISWRVAAWLRLVQRAESACGGVECSAASGRPDVVMGFEVGYLTSTGDQARLPGSRRPADTQQVPSPAQHCDRSDGCRPERDPPLRRRMPGHDV